MTSFFTHRGTHVEMKAHPQWGMTCYMDGEIQSCEFDEAVYHEGLVHPILHCIQPKRVLIVGGGEGATAREVLRSPNVQWVDMIEWDRDVLALFQLHYRQWAKGAWEDTRLHLCAEDILEVLRDPPIEPYDVILVDLFDPTSETLSTYHHILTTLTTWLTPRGGLVAYAGMKGTLSVSMDQPTGWSQYEVEVPSFGGSCCFLWYSSRIIV